MAIDIRFTPYRPGTASAGGERISSIDPRLTRTSYFDGQLLKASDLTRDQIYLDERLLELGQVLGSGIVRGLEVTLVDQHVLRVEPGIAVAPSGRVLQLAGSRLEINLQNSAFIAVLNKGLYRQFQRGLYAVALTHAEMVDDVAEAYPADLSAERVRQVASYAEGVEVRLVPMNLALPRSSGLGVRAALARELVSGNDRLALPSDDAVALGLLAIERGRMLWLDRGLLRRPLRPANTLDALQQDLAAHYAELFQEVQASRQSSGLAGAFPASQYFQVLPPFGPLPKSTIDPVAGTQVYFPAAYDVSIAPVRRDDLAGILAESARLAPMDLARDADSDIMVLVPMGDAAFAARARQLEAPAAAVSAGLGRLARLDRLSLRILPLPQVHRIDTDADVWRAIWTDADAGELVYVRRPPRTAETNVSAVVLALGMKLPAASEATPAEPEDLEDQLDAALDRASSAEAESARLKGVADARQEQIDKLQAALAGGADPLLAEAQATAEALRNDVAKLHDALAEAGKTIEELKSQAGSQAALGKLLPLARLAELRGADPAAAEKLDAQLGDSDEARLAAIDILLLAERANDDLLWASLLQVAKEPSRLPKLRDILAEAMRNRQTMAMVFAEQGADFGLASRQVAQWKTLVG